MNCNALHAFNFNKNSFRFIREITFYLRNADVDSDFFTRAALFAVKENVVNFISGKMSIQNIEYLKNLNKEKYFSLKVKSFFEE